jgi:uncharacterized protein (DUF305 family)
MKAMMPTIATLSSERCQNPRPRVRKRADEIVKDQTGGIAEMKYLSADL